MILQQLNFPAILVSAVIYFVLGAMWYSPLLFAGVFIKYRGFMPEEMQAAQMESTGFKPEYLIVLVVDVITAFALAIFIALAAPASPLDGMLVGLIVVAGLSATSTLTYTNFSGPHKMLWVIYTGYQVVAFAIMSLILTLWR
jgi:hypothetical protein